MDYIPDLPFVQPNEMFGLSAALDDHAAALEFIGSLADAGEVDLSEGLQYFGGLSTPHISPKDFENLCTQLRERELAEALWKDKKAEHNKQLASAVFWVDGSLCRVNLDRDPVERQGGGKRGLISLFSAASRLRLLRKLATVQREKMPLFVTLTYPDGYFEHVNNPERWKRDIDTLAKRLEDTFPGVGGAWRLELKSRKSGAHIGEYFPHFHMLLWGVRPNKIYEFREWLEAAWHEVNGAQDANYRGNGTKVEQLRTQRGVMSYVSKYVAKEDKEQLGRLMSSETGLHVGRWWGFVRREVIPWVRPIWIQLENREAAALMRLVRRFASHGYYVDRFGNEHKPYKFGGSFAMSAATVVLNASDWYYKLDELLYPSCGVPGVSRCPQVFA